MEKRQMSHGYRRTDSCCMPSAVPYNMPRTDANCSANHSDDGYMKRSANPSMDSSYCHDKEASMYKHLEHLPLAMAYVPCQKFTTTYDTSYALKVGTIFPDLCKPFCGKRGMMRC